MGSRIFEKIPKGSKIFKRVSNAGKLNFSCFQDCILKTNIDIEIPVYFI